MALHLSGLATGVGCITESRLSHDCLSPYACIYLTIERIGVNSSTLEGNQIVNESPRVMILAMHSEYRMDIT